VCLLSASALAQAPDADEIVANRNRIPAGKREKGMLSVQLELRSGAWHAEAHRTNIRVGRSSEARGAAAEDLRLRQELDVNFESDDGLVGGGGYGRHVGIIEQWPVVSGQWSETRIPDQKNHGSIS